jgi:hypothetical protein
VSLVLHMQNQRHSGLPLSQALYSMKKIIYIILLSSFISPILADEKCHIPGKAMHWVVSYCMYLSETDDFFSGNVQACFKNNNGYKIKNTCENKTNYKTKICQLSVDNGYLKNGVDACVKDNEFIPRTVKNDGM